MGSLPAAASVALDGAGRAGREPVQRQRHGADLRRQGLAEGLRGQLRRLGLVRTSARGHPPVPALHDARRGLHITGVCGDRARRPCRAQIALQLRVRDLRRHLPARLQVALRKPHGQLPARWEQPARPRELPAWHAANPVLDAHQPTRRQRRHHALHRRPGQSGKAAGLARRNHARHGDLGRVARRSGRLRRGQGSPHPPGRGASSDRGVPAERRALRLHGGLDHAWQLPGHRPVRRFKAHLGQHRQRRRYRQEARRRSLRAGARQLQDRRGILPATHQGGRQTQPPPLSSPGGAHSSSATAG